MLDYAGGGVMMGQSLLRGAKNLARRIIEDRPRRGGAFVEHEDHLVRARHSRSPPMAAACWGSLPYLLHFHNF